MYIKVISLPFPSLIGSRTRLSHSGTFLRLRLDVEGRASPRLRRRRRFRDWECHDKRNTDTNMETHTAVLVYHLLLYYSWVVVWRGVLYFDVVVLAPRCRGEGPLRGVGPRTSRRASGDRTGGWLPVRGGTCRLTRRVPELRRHKTEKILALKVYMKSTTSMVIEWVYIESPWGHVGIP